MTALDFVDKIAWEGGPAGALAYGLRASDADDPRLGELWQAIENRYSDAGHEGESLEELTEQLFRYATSAAVDIHSERPVVPDGKIENY
jgi:hypothetical protein